MIRLIKLFSMFFLTVSMQGCLIFHTVSYEINLADAKSGSVKMEVTDIRSDAMNSSELEEDKIQLFSYMYRGEDFLEQMKEEGKNITDRQLLVVDKKLNGHVEYSFDDISKVEGIVYQEPFYFITLNIEDSVIFTNGEIVTSDDYKRIMWDNSMKILKFKMFSADVENSNLVKLSQYFDED
ncbi:MAG: hypothetical protein KJN64_15465 [Ignavibacteria bacterium]|nr:hypothetical protein [Ignavibacteria bacterium]MBT8382842.1 hypothetical protein [Ignavibacteria bacterium]MBT8393074.1 hypothetical protein [Ignavibacteria bacterium]NNJ53583.1 hypothetical protein [Ignavibacteriaceae bacterium]NNL20190.1 hypothetical protein [Ignavibacteriaceae bacterium]